MAELRRTYRDLRGSSECARYLREHLQRVLPVRWNKRRVMLANAQRRTKARRLEYAKKEYLKLRAIRKVLKNKSKRQRSDALEGDGESESPGGGQAKRARTD